MPCSAPRSCDHRHGQVGLTPSHGAIDRFAVVSTVGRYRGNRVGDLLNQGADLRCVVFLVARQFGREDFAGAEVNREMEFAPRSPCRSISHSPVPAPALPRPVEPTASASARECTFYASVSMPATWRTCRRRSIHNQFNSRQPEQALSTSTQPHSLRSLLRSFRIPCKQTELRSAKLLLLTFKSEQKTVSVVHHDGEARS